MKKFNYYLLLLPVIAAMPFYIMAFDKDCFPSKQHTFETDDTQYFNGEILTPNYVHIDTLIVTDAKLLNYCMEKYDAASDGDINDILSITTKKY